MPPDPLVPLPTTTETAPAVPLVAELEPSLNTPLFPLLDVPVLNTTHPEEPRVPLFRDWVQITPLLVDVPHPLRKHTLPPVT